VPVQSAVSKQQVGPAERVVRIIVVLQTPVYASANLFHVPDAIMAAAVVCVACSQARVLGDPWGPERDQNIFKPRRNLLHHYGIMVM
jgi:hypothetical protein